MAEKDGSVDGFFYAGAHAGEAVATHQDCLEGWEWYFCLWGRGEHVLDYARSLGKEATRRESSGKTGAQVLVCDEEGVLSVRSSVVVRDLIDGDLWAFAGVLVVVFTQEIQLASVVNSKIERYIVIRQKLRQWDEPGAKPSSDQKRKIRTIQQIDKGHA